MSKTRCIVLPRDLDDRGGGEDRGIVDQDVDPAECGHGLGDRAIDASCRVTSSSTAMAASPMLGGGRARPLMSISAIATRAPSRDIGLGKGPPDAARRAGDQRGFAVEPFHPMRSPWASKRCRLSPAASGRSVSPW
jgi:hypothetical protein